MEEKKKQFPIHKNIADITMYNYAGVTMMNKEWMIICGGIQYNLQNISKKVYILQIEEMLAIEMPPMRHIRYTFPVIKKNHYYYVLGGRVYG